MSLFIRNLEQHDIPAALTLCRSAGWNQLHDDWLRMIQHEPQGCFAAILDDQLVGTVTTTRYGTELAWIGMMLVHPDARRQGVATHLMQQSLAYLSSKKVRCIKLDATPAGLPVYARLGFQAEWQFHRWQRSVAAPCEKSQVGGNLSPANIQRDRRALGADRSPFLTKLSAGSDLYQHPDGFGMLRQGYLATYLGPLIATTSEAAEQIAEALLGRAEGTVFWDVPHPNQQAVDLAGRLGFAPVRDLTRMWTGQELVCGDLSWQYALSDPATG